VPLDGGLGGAAVRLGDEAIETTLGAVDGAPAACAALELLALEGGGMDNVTVVLVDLEPSGSP
jgi:serine/threonine protein phosphatase PrpC